MAFRQLYIVNATQVVVSENNPHGVFSVIDGYPKTFDSRSYNATEDNPNGDSDKAIRMAKSEYFSRQSALLASDSRVMWTVTLTMANGRTIMSDSFGAFPDMTPAPEPEPEPTPEPEPEEPEEEPAE